MNDVVSPVPLKTRPQNPEDLLTSTTLDLRSQWVLPSYIEFFFPPLEQFPAAGSLSVTPLRYNNSFFFFFFFVFYTFTVAFGLHFAAALNIIFYVMSVRYFTPLHCSPHVLYGY
jgi:hypothetical protein